MSATLEPAPPCDIRWDLSALFASREDPAINALWKRAGEDATEFETQFRGKIADAGLQANVLLDALKRIERIFEETEKPVSYASLLFAADTSDPKNGAFLQAQMEKASEIRVKLMFFELELQVAPEETIQRLLQDPALENYRHFIKVARLYSPYRLSEPEEVLLEETANTGVRAWVRLFEEVTSNHVYRVRRPGSDVEEELTHEEVMNLLRDPDRSVRQAGADSLTQGMHELQRVICFIYNNLLQDKKVGDRLRKHPYPEHSRHLANELEQQTVELVVGLCKERASQVERYYELKRPLLGLDQLTHIDRYAPLFEAKERIEFDRAREIVLGSFGEFSDEMRARAAEFFERRWIDAEPRHGKTGGAFCAYNTTDTHPVVLMSYLGRMRDVGTLAHELGHGVHGSLSRSQSFFNLSGTLPMAELASIFGEQLVFERLTSGASERDQLALYADKIESTFASVFRQAAMYRFEQRCHLERRESGELTPERFGEVWQDELQAMFGKGLTLGDQHRLWWMYVAHFFFAPFYVYAYAFGELLSLSLFQRARAEGPGFARQYIELLRLGGSRSPQELMALVGVDLNDRSFWLGGFEVVEKMIDRFEELSKRR